jgi:hypothetical protein
MLARAGLIVVALVSPALVSPTWAEPGDYPPGLFERSPLIDTPAAVRPSHGPEGQAKNLHSVRAGGDCHHYRVWSYPWPQPC